MDTSAYLLELAQKFHLSSFDGDLSHLNSSDGSSTASPDLSSADTSEANLLDSQDVSSIGGDISLARSPLPIARRSAPPPATSSSSGVSGSLGPAESKSQERSDRNDDLRIKYEQLKKNFRKQGEELERTTK